MESKRWSGIALSSLLLMGCSSTVPELPQIKPVEVTHYTMLQGELGQPAMNSEQQLVEAAHLPQQWWQLFQSPTITELVEEGLTHSPTLEAAQATLRAVEQQYRSDWDGVQLPAVDLSLGGNRAQSSGAAVGATGSGSALSTEQLELQISYRIDLFGGKAAKLQGSRAMVLLRQYQMEQMRVELTANIVRLAIQLASLEKQMIAMQKIIMDESAHLAVTEQQYQIGVIPKSDLLSQRASLAQRRTEMPPLKKAHAVAQHQLALLLGKSAGEMNQIEIDLDAITLPEALPLVLPSHLTRQRADVLAAEALLLQQAAVVGVAHANQYPALDLSVSFGQHANQLSDLLSADAMVWGVGAGLLHPLFRGEQLRAKEQAEREQFNAVAANYRQTVLNAFREVADALRTLQLDSEQLQLSQEADRLAAETLALVEQQHRQGAVSYLTLLNAQRQLQQARIQSIQAHAALYSDSAALLVALGGGWWAPVEEEL